MFFFYFSKKIISQFNRKRKKLIFHHLLADEEGTSGSDANSYGVYNDLMKQSPDLKLVYVTPEKLNNSGKLCNIITRLYNQNKVARLVIDEAHCVSAWGHDFRKDYTQLGDLRQRIFPNTPVISREKKQI